MMAEKDVSAWDYAPHTGPHEFRPWTVLPDFRGRPWLAPGCTCGTIRSAGSPTEGEWAMRLWWDEHAKRAGHETPATRRCPTCIHPEGYDRLSSPCPTCRGDGEIESFRPNGGPS